MTTTETPYEQGRRACFEGVLFKNCPYEMFDDRKREWNVGWLSAFQETNDRLERYHKEGLCGCPGDYESHAILTAPAPRIPTGLIWAALGVGMLIGSWLNWVIGTFSK